MASKIEGPLGIWPWPILNAIIEITSDGDDVGFKEYNVIRDENGNIESVEVIRGGET